MKNKQTFLNKLAAMLLLLFCMLPGVQAQKVSKVKFCDRSYEYGAGKDSVTLFFSIHDEEGKRVAGLSLDELKEKLVIKEDGNAIPAANATFTTIGSGKRIPAEYTFSVLIDQTISRSDKEKIFGLVKELVESAPDGCVYVSFFGDEVGNTESVTSANIEDLRKKMYQQSETKYFYSAIYAKLCEFNNGSAEYEEDVKVSDDYSRNDEIAKRAAENNDKNILFVFTDGYSEPDMNDMLDFIAVTEYQNGKSHLVPRVYAFYFSADGEESNIQLTLENICNPKDESRKGQCMSASDVSQVLDSFMQVVSDQMYDYSFTYKATADKTYAGAVQFAAEWRGDKVGEADFSIGSAEQPWPNREKSVGETAVSYVLAIVVALLTIFIFFMVMKVIVPSMHQRSFKSKYYKRFVPDASVSRRICTYCRQEILEGQLVVTRCKHVMHVRCWKENGYKCAEFGQNCNEGVEDRVQWKNVFTWHSIMDCHQTVAGVLAALISWVIFQFIGGVFDSISQSVVGIVMEDSHTLFGTCVAKTSAFLAIGMLLGFFLSIIFRYNDEYRRKNVAIWLKIFGMSIFTAIISMLAFAVGAMLMCLMVGKDATVVGWYCSLPAYLLFSISLSLSLTIMSSIPLKSALLGGLISSVIGFFVLLLTSNSLFSFIIFGGGLGAALVTVRMLAERYFLIFKVGTDTKRIPIHKWMGATGGGNKVNIGMTNNCEIQMNWEKANKVAKQHVQLYIDQERKLPVLKPLAGGVLYNGRTDLPVNKPVVLSEGDTFKVGDTTFRYTEMID